MELGAACYVAAGADGAFSALSVEPLNGTCGEAGGAVPERVLSVLSLLSR